MKTLFEDISIHQMPTVFPKASGLSAAEIDFLLLETASQAMFTDLSFHISDWTPSWFPQGPEDQL